MAKQKKILRSFESNDPLDHYITEISFRMTPAQKKLYEVTLMHPKSIMMGAPEVLQLLQNLIRAIKAKNVIDVGVFTGCSTLAQALALPEDGKVVACDIQEETIKLGKPFWEE
ncbi:catechol O-methyltransferase domain-containing protein 1-like, partial [Limulus polyphemus]|uniref:Catechol O-methyltransferase domain-containing protein 1-like n=1 Tax=Limulus polyphemus TaxID=6850 RepID=A0ABM1C1X8_LIMPO